MPMARKRPFIIVAAATAAISVPPPANTASAANWAEPAKTNADAATAWTAEKPGLAGHDAEGHRQHEADDRVGDAEPHAPDERLPHRTQARWRQAWAMTRSRARAQA